ncbi:MAG: hypothetical protein ABEL76_13620 [Bradymonadaceae bacterium]
MPPSTHPLALRDTAALALLAVVWGGCDGESSAPSPEDAAVADTADADEPLRPTSQTFECIRNWTKVRRFYITRTNGPTAPAVDVARSEDGGRYPPGTLIQLVPREAMFKHRPGWSPETNNWEFFVLEPTEDTTRIVDRGTTDVENRFGGNCADCHSQAAPKWDFVCERDHGCPDIPIGGDTIRVLQQQDPRCDDG